MYALDCTSDSAQASSQLALGPSPDIKPISYGLVSLWDMLRLYAERFFVLSSWLAQMQMMFTQPGGAASGSIAEGMVNLFDERALSYIETECGKFIICCDEVGFSGTSTTLRLIIQNIITSKIILKTKAVPDPYSGFAKSLIHLFGEAIRRLKEDTEKYIFIQIAPTRAGFYSSNGLDDAAAHAFPKADKNMKEASRCYALEAHNASIYHAMMVLEAGLPALAKRLQVRFRPDKASWGNLIEDVQRKIASELNLLAHPPRGSVPLGAKAAKNKKSFLDGCQGAAMQFGYFKDVWRNHIAHGRADYEDTDALKCLRHVRDFMSVLAIQLRLRER